jgi:hypothetical protein
MAKSLPAYPRGLDFEQVWAALMENREWFRETADRVERQMKENDERLTKQVAEIDRIVKETALRQAENALQMKETDRQMKETGKRISELGSRFGEMVEYLVMPDLVDKFRELGFEFTKAYPEATIKDKKNKILAEIDITLENGDKAMVVEVKSKPSIKDVRDHIERMEKVRLHADLHGDRRKYLGAIAGMVVKDNVREFALKTGFYVLEPAGNTFTIIEPKGRYKPREW